MDWIFKIYRQLVVCLERFAVNNIDIFSRTYSNGYNLFGLSNAPIGS